MASADPEARAPTRHVLPSAQCRATSKTSGQQCTRPAVPGATVCIYHGGGAPQVQRAARLRLLELVDPAVATLAREMATATSSADRQRAANSILDRAGIARAEGVDPAAAQALLVSRLLALREAGALGPAAPPDPAAQPGAQAAERPDEPPAPDPDLPPPTSMMARLAIARGDAMPTPPTKRTRERR